MTYYTVTITNNETKQKQTYYCNGIVGSLLNADEYEASDVTFDRVKLAKGGD